MCYINLVYFGPLAPRCDIGVNNLARVSRWPSGRWHNMEYVYILQSKINGRYYIGSTNDLVRRLGEHNSGQTKSLKNLLPMKLVFSKVYEEIGAARKMELHLKKLKSRVILEKIIKEKDIKTGP